MHEAAQETTDMEETDVKPLSEPKDADSEESTPVKTAQSNPNATTPSVNLQINNNSEVASSKKSEMINGGSVLP